MPKRKTAAEEGGGATTDSGKGSPVDSSDLGVAGGDEGVNIAKDEPDFNLFVGTDMGFLKGVSFGSEIPISKSFTYRPEGLKEKPPPVKSLTWADPDEKELLVCYSNHIVKTYNTKLRCFTRQAALDVGDEDSSVVGLYCHEDPGKYVVGLSDGTVSVWNYYETTTTLSFKTCKETSGSKVIPDLRKIRQCPSNRHYYATGGNENDLKIWNLSSEQPEEPVFKARNVPHDELDLRVPVWVEDLTFLPRTFEVVAVGTRYGQVRLYDVRAKNRPVSNVKFAEHPIMSISSTMNDRQVIVGTAGGETGLYDLRNPGKEKLLRKYRGPVGSVRCVLATPEEPYFISCGLDRHLYVYKLNQKEPVKKLYMCQQLNCLAISKSFTLESCNETNNSSESAKKSLDEGDWANIPPDVLLASEPNSPIKKPRKLLR